jgi:hypothetical protein
MQLVRRLQQPLQSVGHHEGDIASLPVPHHHHFAVLDDPVHQGLERSMVIACTAWRPEDATDSDLCAGCTFAGVPRRAKAADPAGLLIDALEDQRYGKSKRGDELPVARSASAQR